MKNSPNRRATEQKERTEFNGNTFVPIEFGKVENIATKCDISIFGWSNKVGRNAREHHFYPSK